jgi:hypothetical protein
LINKGLPCVSKEPVFSKRKIFGFLNGIHERNPQIYPQKVQEPAKKNRADKKPKWTDELQYRTARAPRDAGLLPLGGDAYW